MTENDRRSGTDDTSDEVTVETTSVFRADFLNDLDAPAGPAGETAVSGVEGLPVGVELLAPYLGDTRLLSLGYAIEQLRPMRRAPASTPTL